MAKVWWRTLGFALLAAMLATSTASAQPFSSGSTGADGALDFPGAAPGTVIDFDPAALNPPRDTDGDGVYHFTTITIPADVTLRFRANKAGAAPIHWLATGAVTINGILDLNGEDGHGSSPAISRLPSVPGPGGFAGGFRGRAPNTAPQGGFGPGGGPAGSCASYARQACSNSFAYGNAFLLPLIGGSGGGGGQSNGGGGGAGGGALLIASSVSININGAIQAKGGTGGTGEHFRGGGSGGAIRLVTPTITGTGTLTVAGGSLVSVGRIRLEASQNTFTGSITGDARTVTLLASTILLLTSPQPKVRVTSVGGQAISANPKGSFDPVDVTISTAQAVTIALEGKNIPTGTTVAVTVVNETESSQVVTSSPLSGAVELSTASANVTIPAGFSRIFTRATW